MKKLFSTLVAAFVALAMNGNVSADTVTVKNVHLCCGGCVKGVNKAVGKVKGVTSDVDRKAGSVKLAGDSAALKKALAALGNAGFTGKTDGALKVPAAKAKKGKVASLKLSGVHLCCGACVRKAKAAIKDVKGVSGNTIANKAKSFEVSGNFEPQELIDALAAAGFAGRPSK
jgi:periplasmic mercuric ion binding protein